MSSDRSLSCFLSNKFENSFMAIATVAVGIVNSCPILAQITPDTSLGDESSVVTPGVEIKGETADRIDGGAIRDRNLFHSFFEFNIDAAQRVYFANPENIEQIFTRVTIGWLHHLRRVYNREKSILWCSCRMVFYVM